MQQVTGLPSNDPIVVVYTAQTWLEAVVVRGLLESAGIPSPAFGDGNPGDPSLVLRGIEIYALHSHADTARRVIAEYVESAVLGDDDAEEFTD